MKPLPRRLLHALAVEMRRRKAGEEAKRRYLVWAPNAMLLRHRMDAAGLRADDAHLVAAPPTLTCSESVP